MYVKDMDEFQDICREKLVNWFNNHRENKIDKSNTFVVWGCKSLHDYKLLVCTCDICDTIYAEYTYNSDKQEFYENIISKKQMLDMVCEYETNCFLILKKVR